MILLTVVKVTYPLHVRHVGVVGGLARQQRHSRRAAQRHGAVVLVEGGALGGDVLGQQRLVLRRVHQLVLVVGQDEDDVGLRGSTFALASSRSRRSSRVRGAQDLQAKEAGGEQDGRQRHLVEDLLSERWSWSRSRRRSWVWGRVARRLILALLEVHGERRSSGGLV